MAQGSAKSLALANYRLHSIVTYTSDDTFTKANYGGIKAVLAMCQGGGGGSGGCDATGSGEVASAGGGAGGGYAESFILESDLAATEAVTVGASGAAGGVGLDGGAGGDSIFDTISGDVTGAGGSGGADGDDVQPLSGVPGGGNSGGLGTGDLVIPGEYSTMSFALHTARIYVSFGGASHWGGDRGRGVSGGTAAAATGRSYGGGAMGGCLGGSSSAIAGAAGGIGLVVVWVFA